MNIKWQSTLQEGYKLFPRNLSCVMVSEQGSDLHLGSFFSWMVLQHPCLSLLILSFRCFVHCRLHIQQLFGGFLIWLCSDHLSLVFAAREYCTASNKDVSAVSNHLVGHNFTERICQIALPVRLFGLFWYLWPFFKNLFRGAKDSFQSIFFYFARFFPALFLLVFLIFGVLWVPFQSAVLSYHSFFLPIILCVC